jgi:hypothetical protein
LVSWHSNLADPLELPVPVVSATGAGSEVAGSSGICWAAAVVQFSAPSAAPRTRVASVRRTAGVPENDCRYRMAGTLFTSGLFEYPRILGGRVCREEWRKIWTTRSGTEVEVTELGVHPCSAKLRGHTAGTHEFGPRPCSVYPRTGSLRLSALRCPMIGGAGARSALGRIARVGVSVVVHDVTRERDSRVLHRRGRRGRRGCAG